MAMHLVTNVLGSFVLRDGKIILQERYSGEPGDIANQILKTEDSVADSEDRLLRKLIDTGNREVYVSNPARFRGMGYDLVFHQERQRVQVHEIAGKISFPYGEVDSLMGKVNRILVRRQMREIDPDQLIIQAVDSLNDIDEAVNRLVERLREWYSLHFPELDAQIPSHDVYASLVLGVGSRAEFKNSNMGLDEKQKQRIKASASDSIGIDFDAADISAIKSLAKPIQDLYARQKEIEDYITLKMASAAPNISDLAGPLLGARLVSLAHGLKRLATLPAGTIQILGAEDAFFRFLRTGQKPPKHGIIFQHPDIRGAKREVRGKLARTLAAKIAIATRADVYGKQKISEKLKADFQKRVKALTK